MKARLPYSEATYSAILSLLLIDSLRDDVSTWVLDGESQRIIAKRIEQLVLSEFPCIPGDNKFRIFWMKQIRRSLRDIDWNVVAAQLCGSISEIENEVSTGQSPSLN